MKIAKLPGRFLLPEYTVPCELELSLTNSWIVNYLQVLIKRKVVPRNDLITCYTVLLCVEEHFENEEITKHKLYSQFVLCNEKKQFIINVPELKEDDPFVSAGDFVLLYDDVSKTEHILFIVDIRNGYLTAEPIKNKNSVEWFSKNTQYDISFKLSHYPSRSAQQAINTMEKWIFRNDILNPQYKSVNNLSTVKQGSLWFDSNILNNNEQKKAVCDIINKTAFPAPYILFGPPGTGKTATIVEAISQICYLDEKNKVLVCTPANSPADDLTKKLQKTIPPDDILRLCSVSREKTLEDADVIKSSNVYFEGCDEEKRQTMTMDKILKKRVIICTLTSSLRLSALKLGPSYFSHIIIDEAAQAKEPETWIPISLLVSKCQTSTQVVLSGDPKQLGPVVKSKLIDHLLGVSMMERLMNLDCYTNDSKKQSYTTKLIKNFRSHISILKVPNELFYNDELLCCGGLDTKKGVDWHFLPNKKFPIIFRSVLGEEERNGNHPSPYNLAEANTCLKYVERLKIGGKFEEENIGIITPFKQQELLIKNELKKLGIFKIQVGTVSVFQGLEKDVIIMSTVRTRLLEHDGKKHIGFLSDKKRFNVAITRAKSLLIVVGNPEILQHDETWYKFIEHCVENGALLGNRLVLSKPPSITSSEAPIKPVEKSPVTTNLQNVSKPVLQNSKQNYTQPAVPVYLPKKEISRSSQVPATSTFVINSSSVQIEKTVKKVATSKFKKIDRLNPSTKKEPPRPAKAEQRKNSESSFFSTENVVSAIVYGSIIWLVASQVFKGKSS